jgi:TonB family protein
MEGTVLVDFMINHRGTAEKVRVLKGSGYALLDSSAMETVVKASPFPVVNISIEVPITYRLSQD